MTSGYEPFDAPRRPAQLPAGFIQRAGAFALDASLWFAFVPMPVSIIVWFRDEPLLPCRWRQGVEVCQTSSGSDLLVSRIAFWSLFTIFSLVIAWQMSRRTTLGQRATGVRVVDDRTGAPVGFGRALARTVATVISAVPLGAGFWWALVDQRGRTWHDRLTGTRSISV